MLYQPTTSVVVVDRHGDGINRDRAHGHQTTADANPDWPPYNTPREHLDEMLDLVAARAAKAIAEAWNSGRLSVPAEDGRPFEREVRALLGHVGGYAPDLLGEADERLNRVGARSAGRARSSIARGLRLPFVELSREFRLSSVAAHVLMVAMAPSIRGGIAQIGRASG